ncbi:reverse transcriptase [Plakobranchus ocellatus]|uniref:Reverse transcriptase n=1 Tax=Plakobranchus ocellatus TaxID=259542 RepID=A0AAV4C1X1_9GAST|nr:reverse transcriptase [Plakobranchus ocellatus]
MTPEGVYKPKEQTSTELNQFQPTSLLKVEGKIFFSDKASRLTKCLTKNSYLNVSEQKEVSGYLEHTNMIWEAIQRPTSRKLQPGCKFVKTLLMNSSLYRTK